MGGGHFSAIEESVVDVPGGGQFATIEESVVHVTRGRRGGGVEIFGSRSR